MFNFLPIETSAFSAGNFSPVFNSTSAPFLPFELKDLISATSTPVIISILRDLKFLWINLEISLSSVESIDGRSSIILTVEPNSEKIFANSHPMTPAPIIINDSGISLNERASSEVIIFLWSILKAGIIRGIEPVAKIMLFAGICCIPDPSFAFTLTLKMLPFLPETFPLP